MDSPSMGETQYEVTHMLSRHETLKALFAILEQANLADTDQALHWQDKRHVNADDLFGHVRDAIESIEPGLVEQWVQSGEVYLASPYYDYDSPVVIR